MIPAKKGEAGKILKMKQSFMTWLFILLGGAVIFLITWPILSTIFGAPASAVWETLLEGEVRRIIFFTFWSSLVATGAAFLMGVPLAYLMARYNFRGKIILESLIDLPIVIPHSAAGIALLLSFGRRSFLGTFFSGLGIRFVSAPAGIVLAMFFVSVPFLIDSAREGFEKVDPDLEFVSRTLGASSWQTFWKVSFPLAWRGILSGLIMMWARGISEFGAVVILAYHPMIAPVLLYERFQTFGLDYAVPVATLILLISLVVFAVLRSIQSLGADR